MINFKAFMRSFLVICALSTFVISINAQDFRNEELIKKLFDESESLYDQGKYRECSAKLKEIIGLNPDIGLVNRMFREANMMFRNKILQNDLTKKEANHLDTFYWQWEKRRRRSPEYINEVISRLKSENPDTRNRAIVQLKNIGHFAIPHLVSYLKDPLSENGMRSTVTLALGQMVVSLRGEGVLPVIELLDSTDPLLLENAAIILGQSKDKRALAALKKVHEDVRHNKTVKNFVQFAIEEISGTSIDKIPEAKELYYDLAMRYLLNDEDVIRETAAAEGVIYRYKANDILEMLNIMQQADPMYGVPTVAPSSWRLYIAEEAIYDAMALDNGFEKAIPLLICILHAQYNQVESQLKDIDRLIDRQILTEADKADLIKRQERLVRVKVLSQLTGKSSMYAALDLALEHNLSEVAVSIIDQIKFITDASEFSEYVVPLKKKEMVEAEPVVDEKADTEVDSKVPADGKTSEPVVVVEETKPEGDEVAPATEEVTPLEGEAKEKTDETPTVVEGDAKEVAPEVEGEKPDEATKQEKAEGEIVSQEIVDSKKPVSLKDAKGLAGPLIKALDFRDVRVRYEAAMTLAHLNPKFKFPGAERVVELLASALGEKDQIAVLIIDSNNQRNNQLTLLLRECGFLTVSAENGTDGIFFSRSFPPKDLVLVASDLKGLNTESVYAELKADYRTKRVPFAVISDSITKVRMAEKYAHIADTLVSPEDGKDALMATVRGLVEKGEAPVSAKMSKENVAIKAAEALAMIKAEKTVFNLESCYDACTKVLTPPERVDAIRLPVLKAMAEFKALPVLPAVVASYLKEENAHPIRLASLYAIGQINPADESAFKALEKSVETANDLKLSEEGSASIGLRQADVNKRIELLKYLRIIKESK